MQQNGVFIMYGGRWYMTAAHRDEDIDTALAAIDKSFAAMKKNNMEFVPDDGTIELTNKTAAK